MPTVSRLPRFGPPPPWLRTLASWRRPPPRVRGALLVLAAIGVAVGLVVSLRSLELDPAGLDLWLLAVVAVVITPLTVLVNATELRAMAGALGGALSWPTSVRTVVLATAGNLLPVPAGALVRVQAMREGGAATGQAIGVNIAAAGLWVSASLLLATIGFARVGVWPALGSAALGLLGVTVSFVVLARSRGSARVGGWLALVELATTVLSALRLWLVLAALGVAAGLGDVLVLGIAGPLAASAGVFPSGLGLAELLAALLAEAVALSAAAGFAATAVGRIIGLAMVAPLALSLGLRDVARATAGPTDVTDPSAPTPR